jgi:hypothetical protein
MSSLPTFLTHYFEADKSPFRNICDLSDEEIESVIETEKDADTAFNRFALGLDFFTILGAGHQTQSTMADSTHLLIWIAEKNGRKEGIERKVEEKSTKYLAFGSIRPSKPSDPCEPCYI